MVQGLISAPHRGVRAANAVLGKKSPGNACGGYKFKKNVVFSFFCIRRVATASLAESWSLWIHSSLTYKPRYGSYVEYNAEQVSPWKLPNADIFCGRPPDLWPSELNIGTLVTPALGKVRTVFVSMPFCFRVTSSYSKDGRTDGRTRPVIWPIRMAP